MFYSDDDFMIDGMQSHLRRAVDGGDGAFCIATKQHLSALALRFGLAAIAAELTVPAHVIEVGTSAGLNLLFDRYCYQVGGQSFGNPASPVQLTAARHGSGPLPDLDVLPDMTASGMVMPAAASTITASTASAARRPVLPGRPARVRLPCMFTCHLIRLFG